MGPPSTSSSTRTLTTSPRSAAAHRDAPHSSRFLSYITALYLLLYSLHWSLMAAPVPRSPPDVFGRHRLQAELQFMSREIGLLQVIVWLFD